MNIAKFIGSFFGLSLLNTNLAKFAIVILAFVFSNIYLFILAINTEYSDNLYYDLFGSLLKTSIALILLLFVALELLSKKIQLNEDFLVIDSFIIFLILFLMTSCVADFYPALLQLDLFPSMIAKFAIPLILYGISSKYVTMVFANKQNARSSIRITLYSSLNLTLTFTIYHGIMLAYNEVMS